MVYLNIPLNEFVILTSTSFASKAVSVRYIILISDIKFNNLFVCTVLTHTVYCSKYTLVHKMWQQKNYRLSKVGNHLRAFETHIAFTLYCP